MKDDEVPNQHTKQTLPPMTPEEELKHLRERVTELQARGTHQLIDARAAAFEMAAKVCDGILEAREIPHDDFSVAEECAKAIRKLAKNVP